MVGEGQTKKNLKRRSKTQPHKTTKKKKEEKQGPEMRSVKKEKKKNKIIQPAENLPDRKGKKKKTA